MCHTKLNLVTKLGQNFWKILVMGCTIWQLWILLLRLWRWWNTMDYEMPSFSDTLWVLLTRFISGNWRAVLEYTFLGQSNSSKSSWTIWLLYWDQVHLPLPHNKYLVASAALWFSVNLVCFALLWFYGISTIVGYLMPNPFYTYILNIYDW